MKRDKCGGSGAKWGKDGGMGKGLLEAFVMWELDHDRLTAASVLGTRARVAWEFVQ